LASGWRCSPIGCSARRWKSRSSAWGAGCRRRANAVHLWFPTPGQCTPVCRSPTTHIWIPFPTWP